MIPQNILEAAREKAERVGDPVQIYRVDATGEITLDYPASGRATALRTVFPGRDERAAVSHEHP
ncbi:MAG: hypothetical protein JXA57_15240 [Armatimonadetes bacterium]|nr:hypothetical protein [Armatimonadota bacterium]